MRRVRHHVVEARWKDISGVAALIADATHTLDVAAWLIPDPAIRRDLLANYLHAYVAHWTMWGSVRVTDDRAAVALWVRRPRPLSPQPPSRVVASEDIGKRVSILLKTFEAAHPGEPHHHLAVLAVHPDARGSGHAAALLANHQPVLDRFRVAATVHLTDDSTQQFFVSRGYLPQERVTIPGGPTIQPMRRPPRHPN